MKPLITTLFVVCAASAGALESMVAATFQHDSLDWWGAVPSGHTPKLNAINTAFSGEYFRVVSFFRDYALDTNSHARITFDFELVRPDGSIDEQARGVLGHDGPARHPMLILGQGVLNVCFDADDPLGEHTIRITAVDHVAGTTNVQTAPIEHRAFALPEVDGGELDAVLFNYPTAPHPAAALAAFLKNEHALFDDENEPIWSAAWFFKTVFEDNPYLLPHLLDAFHKGTNKQQRDIILILALLDELDRLPKLSADLKAFRRLMRGGHVPDPYAEITSGRQLDMLWGEFFARGTLRPVRQIASSLALVEHAGTLRRIKEGKLDAQAREVRRAAMREATFQSALWSIKSNIERSPLLAPYLETLLRAEELEPAAARTLALLLQSIQDNRTKEGSE